MRWSLSEFLQLLEVRSQCWCFVEMGDTGAFRAPASDHVFFYAMVDGAARLSGGLERPIELATGDMVFVISGRAHALRVQADSRVESLSFLDDDEYVDAPPTIVLGSGSSRNRLLCGRLKVRWPAGLNASLMPRIVRLNASGSLINLQALVDATNRGGAAAVLTRAAGMLIVAALRDHPQCQMIFRDATLRDPIARAVQFMETHPFRPWSVEILARKVGMGRSTFAARFIAKTGKSPMEVLTELRMRLAASLLTQTELKVAEIGERVGYRSESAFNRRFVAFYSMTPGQMRINRAANDETPVEPAPSRRSGRNSSAWGMGREQPRS